MTISHLKKKCVGCGACSIICCANAIKMQYDNEGFYYPIVDFSLCVDCGACNGICPVENSKKATGSIVKCYAAYSNNKSTIVASSSGGIYTEIVSDIFRRSGKVYGVAYCDDMQVKHQRMNSIEDIEKFQGSKYVQSDMSEIFSEIKQLLKEGTLVYFSGTPCQVHALKCYLRKEYKNLFTQDIICHGVPSPLIFSKYVSEQEKKNQSKVTSVLFREKKYGWENYSTVIQFENGKTTRRIAKLNPYMKLFYSNLSLRPSCFECPFKMQQRVSDITLADFWGVSGFLPKFSKDQGVNLVMVNSQKGEELFNSIQQSVTYKEVNKENVLLTFSTITKSAAKPLLRDDFFSKLPNFTINELSKCFCKESLPTIIKRYLRVLYKQIKR